MAFASACVGWQRKATEVSAFSHAMGSSCGRSALAKVGFAGLTEATMAMYGLFLRFSSNIRANSGGSMAASGLVVCARAIPLGASPAGTFVLWSGLPWGATMTDQARIFPAGVESTGRHSV
jgi:hypothetical protein